MGRDRGARRRIRPRLTRRGAALMIVGLMLAGVGAGFDLRDLLPLAFIGVAMPILASGFVLLKPPKLFVTREFSPSLVGAGESTSVSLVIRNRSRRSHDVALWHDELPAGLRGPEPLQLPAMGPGEHVAASGDDTVRVRYSVRMRRRGVFAIGPLIVTTGDPFGLASLDWRVGEPHDVVVTPRVTPLHEPPGAAGSIDGVLHAIARRTQPNADEFVAREYRVGDPMRRVHWPATARRGELMVREEEQRGDSEARLVLDTTLTARSRRGGYGAQSGSLAALVDRARDDGAVSSDPDFEVAIEVAASIGVQLLEHGYRLRCEPVCDPDQSTLSVGAAHAYISTGGRDRFLEDLARLDLDAARDRHDDVLEHGHRGMRSRGSPAPGVAVLAAPSRDELRQLVGMRRLFEPALAVVLPGVSSSEVEMLDAAGWRVVRVRRARDIQQAWGLLTPDAAATDATTSPWAVN